MHFVDFNTGPGADDYLSLDIDNIILVEPLPTSPSGNKTRITFTTGQTKNLRINYDDLVEQLKQRGMEKDSGRPR